MAVSAVRSRSYLPRDMRIQSHPSDRNYVRYAAQGVKTKGFAAQFGDISTSGMRLISRFPAKTKVGDSLEVQFSLPGTSIEVKGRATVVRKISDYEFAVSFIGFQESQLRALQAAINEYRRYLRMPSFSKSLTKFGVWFQDHRQGLMIAMTGALVLGGTFAYIHFNSDAYQGKPLKTWGKTYPKQWDWDYYNHIPKRK